MHGHLLSLCRRILPDAAGVVLATPGGRVLAHDDVHDPSGLAREAVAASTVGTSALVEREGSTFLVVFVL